MTSLELLAPAKNLECGMAAIDNGADAVYIGAERYGARAAAGNSLADIEELCSYAHQFKAKVYVTVNTIVYDHELDDTRQLIADLADIGVDAILVQDMSLVGKSRVPLHASTQTDNRTLEKVKWLGERGFRRVVLARELSADEIAHIHREVPDVELEVFVHGALCVSYSGVCYASQHCFQRSANRGECAQFCRMPFSLVDANGTEIIRKRHLLSLKDMCQIDNLKRLVEAGAVSFKIEGRLKDATYVKNVVAAYSQQLNRIVEQSGGRYRRASLGRVEYRFTPNLNKTFNRGFTTYFLEGRQPDIFSPDTPKAMGEYVGKVKEMSRQSFNVSGTAAFANGDGLCFINAQRELEGFRVNRAEGNRLFPQHMPSHLRPGMALYRNSDVAFEKLLSGKSAERHIPLRMRYVETDEGFCLRCWVEELGDVQMGGAPYAEQFVRLSKEAAKSPQRNQILRQITKLGNTPFACDDADVVGDADRWFVPATVLATMRRNLVDQLLALFAQDMQQQRHNNLAESTTVAKGKNPADATGRLSWNPYYEHYPYLYNISNKEAKAFYGQQGLSLLLPAFELSNRNEGNRTDDSPRLLMQCRHCLRFSLGYCVKRGGKRPEWKEPLSLELSDRQRFRLEFDCKQCQMNVYDK